MPFKDKTRRLEYNRNYMKNLRLVVPLIEKVVPVIEKVVPVIEKVVPLIEEVVPLIEEVVPLIEEVVPLSPHFRMRWARNLVRVHREFYKSAWFARWKYELLICHAELKDVLM